MQETLYCDIEKVPRNKRLLTTAPVLKLFDVNKEVVIETDASKDCLLEACLLQEGRPVAYASRSLTASEKKLCPNRKKANGYSFRVRNVQPVYLRPTS